MPRDDVGPVVRAWHDKARGDLEAARACLESESVPGWIVGFHLQQAVEKAFKGLLVAARCEPPRTHDLVRLHQLLIQHGGHHPPPPGERREQELGARSWEEPTIIVRFWLISILPALFAVSTLRLR